jgi:hypothetical protein
MSLIGSKKLKIFKLKYLNLHISETTLYLINDSKIKTGPEGNDILNYFNGLVKRRRSQQGLKVTVTHGKKESEKSPIEINTSHKYENGFISGNFRVLGIKGENLRSQGILRGLDLLIRFLKLFHFHFMEDARFDRLKSRESLNEENQFFAWLHDVLMAKKENTLPIFGHFLIRHRLDFDQKPLDCSEFSEAQIVLMDYFSNLN